MSGVLASPADTEGPGYRFFPLPGMNYGSSNCDSIVDSDDNVIGLSLFTGYAVNERRALSLATINPDVPHGAGVRVIWGKPVAAAEDHGQRDEACRSSDRQSGSVLEDGPRDLPDRVAHGGGRRRLTSAPQSSGGDAFQLLANGECSRDARWVRVAA